MECHEQIEKGDLTMINGCITGYNYGWICPKCGRVYGPYINECCAYNMGKSYYEPTVTFTTTSSEVNINEQNGKK